MARRRNEPVKFFNVSLQSFFSALREKRNCHLYLALAAMLPHVIVPPSKCLPPAALGGSVSTRTGRGRAQPITIQSSPSLRDLTSDFRPLQSVTPKVFGGLRSSSFWSSSASLLSCWC